MEMKGLAEGFPLLPHAEREKFTQNRSVSSDAHAHIHSWRRMTSLITETEGEKLGHLGLRGRGASAASARTGV